MVFRILIRNIFPIFQAKSSSAVLTPSFADIKYVDSLAVFIPFAEGRVFSFLLVKKTYVINIAPRYSATVVPIAAPFIPRAGKPNFPKIRT